jgi:hypothetical protein
LEVNDCNVLIHINNFLEPSFLDKSYNQEKTMPVVKFIYT